MIKDDLKTRKINSFPPPVDEKPLASKSNEKAPAGKSRKRSMTNRSGRKEKVNESKGAVIKRKETDSKNEYKETDSKNDCKETANKNEYKETDSKNECREGRRVSFNLVPTIVNISYNNGIPKAEKKWERRDKTLIFTRDFKKQIRSRAKKYSTMVKNERQITLKYKSEEDIAEDMKSLGLLKESASHGKPSAKGNGKNSPSKSSHSSKSYEECKMIVIGLGYRETEESVKEYFSKFGDLEKAIIEKNSKGYCLGRGTLTFKSYVNTSQVFRLNNRVLRIERIKKQKINLTRVHVSHMGKEVNISRLRQILKIEGFVPENIRIDMGDNGMNKGFGFIEFKTPEDAKRFIEKYPTFSDKVGDASFVEYSKEKRGF